MTLNEILATLGVSITDLARLGIVGVVIILVGCIKPPQLKINLWAWLFQHIGESMNKGVIEEVTSVKEDVDSLKDDVDCLRTDLESHEEAAGEEKARNARQRILRFSDEVLLNQKHSKEHFEEVLDDIDAYEEYCDTHPKYENSKAVFAINTIRRVYDTCLKEKDFLGYEPLPKKEGDSDDN